MCQKPETDSSILSDITPREEHSMMGLEMCQINAPLMVYTVRKKYHPCGRMNNCSNKDGPNRKSISGEVSNNRQ